MINAVEIWNFVLSVLVYIEVIIIIIYQMIT